MKKGVDYIGISVNYVCHDGSGNYLLNKRGTGCRDEHGRWDNGGGALEFGHTVEETLCKEIQEEYTTDILESEFLGYRDIFRTQNNIKTHWLGIYFLVHVDRSKVSNGEPHKFDEIGWFTLDTLPTPLHSQFPETLKILQEKLNESK